MSYEAVVGIPVNASHVIDAVSAIGCPASCQLPDVWFRLDVIGGSKIILHVQPDVITGNLLAPVLPECCGAAPVRKHDDVALVAHQAVIPTIAPSLAESALRPSQEYLDGWIHFSGIEFRRVQDPCQHLLPVHGLQPFLFGFERLQLPKNMLVLFSDLGEAAIGLVHGHQLSRELHGIIGGQQLAIDECENAAEVVPCIFRSYPDRNGCGILGICQRCGNFVQRLQPFGECAEIQVLGVFCPNRIGGVVLETSRQLGYSGNGHVGSDFGHEKPSLVSLVAVASHADPCYARPVRTPDGIGIVASAHRNYRSLARGNVI